MAQFDLHEIAFPTLDDTQIAKLGDCTAATLSTWMALAETSPWKKSAVA